MNPRLKKAAPLILVALLAVLLFGIRQCKSGQAVKPKATETTTQPGKTDNEVVDRDKGFDRRVSYLEYSNHADCRMDCRHINKSEVEDIMRNGHINYNKSDLDNARCPRYALEGITNDNQRVRIVFAQCDTKTEVVTVIDLGTEWPCACPGDDDKYKNRN